MTLAELLAGLPDAASALVGTVGGSKLASKLAEQDFGPDDSKIVSSLLHPIMAGQRVSDWLTNQRQAIEDAPVGGSAYDPRAQQGAAAAMNLAGLIQTGGMPMAPASNGGTLGSILAPNMPGWLKEASQNADAEKLLYNTGMINSQFPMSSLIRAQQNGQKLSKKMVGDLYNGIEKMWHETGRYPWYNAKDRNLTLLGEIPDNQAQITTPADMEFAKSSIINLPKAHKIRPINNFLDHPELYDNYPQLESKHMRFDQSFQPGEIEAFDLPNGQFWPGLINSKTKPILDINSYIGEDRRAKNTLFHELAHAQQALNDLPPGSSPTLFEKVFGIKDKRLAEKKYYLTSGEAQARATGARSHYTDSQLANVSPLRTMHRDVRDYLGADYIDSVPLFQALQFFDYY